MGISREKTVPDFPCFVEKRTVAEEDVTESRGGVLLSC